MAERTFMHVGTPKSGTSYLQSVLWSNAGALREQGLLLPGSLALHYTAAKGTTGRPGIRRRTRGRDAVAWSRLARGVARWPGDALISNELFAPAKAEQAAAALAELSDTELHLVLTVRALHRQLPAAWQQQVKGGHGIGYRDYLEQVRTGTGRHGHWFWEVQDVLDIVRRWAPQLAPQRVHVVTCPTAADDPALLWRRYASVIGVEAGAVGCCESVVNVSLGATEAELLRRVQAARDYRFQGRDHLYWTRRMLAGRLLVNRRSRAIRLPLDTRTWVEQRSQDMTRRIMDAGYDVVGDLDELSWQPSADDARLISEVSEPEIAEASAWAIDRLQEELVERRPAAPVPDVGPHDGVGGILELLEHIRAAETDTEPRPRARPAPRVGLRSVLARSRRVTVTQ